MLGLLISALLAAPNPNLIAYNAIKSPIVWAMGLSTGLNLALITLPYII